MADIFRLALKDISTIGTIIAALCVFGGVVLAVLLGMVWAFANVSGLAYSGPTWIIVYSGASSVAAVLWVWIMTLRERVKNNG